MDVLDCDCDDVNPEHSLFRHHPCHQIEPSIRLVFFHVWREYLESRIHSDHLIADHEQRKQRFGRDCHCFLWVTFFVAVIE